MALHQRPGTSVLPRATRSTFSQTRTLTGEKGMAIGKSVPRRVVDAVGVAVKPQLEKAMRSSKPVRFGLEGLPLDHEQAVKWLLALVRATESKTLREVPTADFLRGWYSVGFLYGGLHPDSAFDHGKEISNDIETVPDIDKTEPRLRAPYYLQSGWPVLLAPVAKEAWRRYRARELNENEFYCSEAVIAGMCYRNPDLIEQVRQERERISL